MKSLPHIAIVLALALPSPQTQACRMARPVPNLSDELVSFASCQDLEKHLETLAMTPEFETRASSVSSPKREKAKAQFSRRAESLAPAASPARAADMALQGPMEMDASGAPEKSTGTNNQVSSVDEADFVKFNGKQIFQLHGGTLRILKAWPASELNEISSVQLKGQPQEMLVSAQTAVVLATEGQDLKATVIDISLPTSPRIATEFNIPGQYRTARLIGETLRIVNQDYESFRNLWSESSTQPTTGWLQEETPRRKLNIRPTTQAVGATVRTLDTIKDCGKIYAPKRVAPSVLTRIITIDLSAKKYDETLAFVPAETVYASETALYLSHSGWSQVQGNSIQQTAIHKFDLPRAQTARYEASGIINGHVINQFAMDEHKGYLRVATNGSELAGGSFLRPDQWQQISRVQVLAVQGRALKSIGQTPDLAKGERLYSARFDGDKGYLVTFRQVDPLFTIDLSNPRRPRVLGELKVPGFSTYIHRLNSTHLLTIGQDADETTGRVRGLKLSIFDVSDFSKPREVKSLIFKSGVSSESSYEHKAFTFHADKGILGIPAVQGTRSALLLFQVTPKDIQPSGELNMTDLQSVRRSFFADEIVFAIGGSGVRAANIKTPAAPLATVQFGQKLAESQW